MSNESSNYKNIFKATAFLGGVQIINIIIGVVRNKVVSLLLGPSGMGIVGLFRSSSQTVLGFTSCGVPTSSMKNLATSYEKGDLSLLGKVIYTLRRLVVCTGSLASIILLVFSRQFSRWSFGSDDYTIGFVCLSFSLLFTQLTAANISIVKGCRRLNYYASANVLGQLVSLIISIPLYYIWGKDAIVPVLIIVSISTFVFAHYYERKIGIPEVKASKDEFKEISTDILKMGIPLAVSEVFPILASYFIRLHVSSGGGVGDVGLFSAGFTILNGYVGMIFSAMSSDYVPRLSAIVDDNKECENTINRQIEISILILLPLLVLMIAMSKVVVWILFSNEFFPMIGMICWGAIGMLLKTFNWCYGCILVPKRDSRPYFVFSVLSAVFYLGASVVLYNLFGVTGLGISFLASNAFDFIVAYIFISRKYNIRLAYNLIAKLLIFLLVLVSMIFLNLSMTPCITSYVLEGIVVLSAAIYSIGQLNRLTGLSHFIRSKINKQ